MLRPPFENYTVGKYNATILKLISGKNGRIQQMALFSALVGVLFPGGPNFTDTLGSIIYASKISWIIPLPIFIIQAATTHIALDPDLLINPNELDSRRLKAAHKRIIFQITTRGENLETLKRSFESTKYWIRRVREERGLNFGYEIWIVTEEDKYIVEKSFFNGLEGEGVKIVVVPSKYETPNHASFKARALQYACDVRIESGIDTPNDWVYHQDTETMIGEDTVLGNLDFVTGTDEGQLVGAGVILYPQSWKYRHNSIEETTRSVGDLGAMGQMKLWGLVPFGYHGSHLIVRADVENDIGWDYGRLRSEDLLFSLKLKERFGAVTRRLKGFAYEKPPLTSGDQLKQRRRWVLGTIEVLRRKDYSMKNKLLLVYSLSVWMLALPSITVSIIGLLYPVGGIFFLVGGLISGFLWWMIYNAYKVGLGLHELYIDGVEPLKGLKLVWGATQGMLLDAVAPWYAIIRRTSGYDEIRKDDQLETKLEDVVEDVETYTENSSSQPSV